MTKEEYLKLIQEVIRQEELETGDIECGAWVPAESEAKSIIPGRIGSIDASNLKKEALRNAITKYKQLAIGDFLINIVDNDSEDLYDFHIYEMKYQTATSRPCKIQEKVSVLRDTRFEGRPWLSYFNMMRMAKNVPLETFLDIIRWIQAIHKLPAFI